MQAQTPEVSGAKATTARARPTMASHRLELPNHCDICGQARSTRKHAACSRIRKQRMDAHWQTVMADQAAKRAAKEGRRHA